jgi:hypothetical protein
LLSRLFHFCVFVCHCFHYEKFLKKFLNGKEEYFKTELEKSRSLPTKFCRVVPNIFGSSIWNLVHVSHPSGVHEFCGRLYKMLGKFWIPALECRTLNRTVESAASRT